MKTILFYGDSITYYGEFKNGYIHLINLLLRKDPASEWKAIGSGRGGDKVLDLINRKKELFTLNPDIIVIYIGINDVWHRTAQKDSEKEQQFKLNYKTLIGEIQSMSNAEIILCTLSVIGERKSGNSYDVNLDAYSEIIKEIALEYQLRLCDLRTAFINYLRVYNTDNKASGILTHDTVHLNDDGNKLVAETIFPLLTTIIE